MLRALSHPALVSAIEQQLSLPSGLAGLNWRRCERVSLPVWRPMLETLNHRPLATAGEQKLALALPPTSYCPLTVLEKQLSLTLPRASSISRG
jgi:hypothetical protein